MESRAWHERRCCGVVRAATVACVAGFVCAGGALIFFNRYLMRTLGFPFPALMVGYSALANSWICYAVVSACFPHLVAEEAVWPGRLTWRRFLRAVLPVGALLGAELTLSAIAMARLSLTLVEVFKANVGALVLLLRSLLLGAPFSVREFAVVVVLGAGLALVIAQDVSVTSVGLLVAVGGVVSGALRIVALERLLMGEDGARPHPVAALVALGPAVASSLLPTFLALEARSVAHSAFFSRTRVLDTIGLLACQQLLALALNICEIGLVSLAGGTTLCVVGAARLIGVVYLSAALVDHMRASPAAIAGLLLAVLGIASYAALHVAAAAAQRGERAQGDTAGASAGGVVSASPSAQRASVKVEAARAAERRAVPASAAGDEAAELWTLLEQDLRRESDARL